MSLHVLHNDVHVLSNYVDVCLNNDVDVCFGRYELKDGDGDTFTPSSAREWQDVGVEVSATHYEWIVTRLSPRMFQTLRRPPPPPFILAPCPLCAGQ